MSDRMVIVSNEWSFTILLHQAVSVFGQKSFPKVSVASCWTWRQTCNDIGRHFRGLLGRGTPFIRGIWRHFTAPGKPHWHTHHSSLIFSNLKMFRHAVLNKWDQNELTFHETSQSHQWTTNEHYKLNQSFTTSTSSLRTRAFPAEEQSHVTPHAQHCV